MPELSEVAIEVLSPNVCRALSDRELDVKRKGAKEVEKIIVFFQEQTDISVATDKTNLIIKLLVNDFLHNQSKDIKIGGLLALFCVAKGLQFARTNLALYLPAIIKPVIASYKKTNDIVTKYYTSECLYNLALTAPLEVSRYLEDLFSIDCQLWSETHPNLIKAAECTDSALLSLAHRHDEGSHQLFNLISEELSKSSTTPHVWLLKWVHHCINLHSDKDFRPEYYKHAIGLFRMAGHKLDAENQSLINVTLGRLASVCDLSEKTNWKCVFSSTVSDILTTSMSPTSPSNAVQQAHSVEVFMKELLSRDPDDETRQTRAQMDFIIRTTFALMRVTGSNASSMMQRWLNFAKSEKDVEMTNKIYREISGMLKDDLTLLSENQTILNGVKEWLMYLQQRPAEERKEWHFDFEGLVKLTGDVREEMSKCAGECVGILTSLETGFVEPLLRCAVQRVAVAETERQSEAAIQLIRNLMSDSETHASQLVAAIHELPVTSYQESMTKQLAEIILIVYLGVFNRQNKHLLKSDIWQAATSSPESWFATKLVGIEDFSPHYQTSCAWLTCQAELLVTLLELPECYTFRRKLGVSLYKELLMILPCASKSYAIAEHRSKSYGTTAACVSPELKIQVAVEDEPTFQLAKTRVVSIILPAIARYALRGSLWSMEAAEAHKLESHAVAEVICQPSQSPAATRKLTTQSINMPEPPSPPADDAQDHEVTVDREGIKGTVSKPEAQAVAQPNRSVDDAAKHDVSRMTTDTPNSPLA